MFVKSTGFSQEWAHPSRHRHFSSLYRKKATKLWPQCRGMYWTVTFVKRSTPNTVSAICNKRGKETLRVYFLQHKKQIQPVHSLKSTHAYSWSQVIYFFMDSSIHLLELIPPKNDLDEWKLYCKICLLPLVLIRQVLVCYLCFWALSLFHAITLNPKVRANIMPLYCC